MLNALSYQVIYGTIYTTKAGEWTKICSHPSLTKNVGQGRMFDSTDFAGPR
jgi:hypothetical protein